MGRFRISGGGGAGVAEPETEEMRAGSTPATRGRSIDDPSPSSRRLPRWVRPASVTLMVTGIVVAAGLARLFDLANQPGGLYPDEAGEGISAQRILHEAGYHPIFIPEDGGRPALFAYMVAAAFRLFGETAVVLRGTSAVLGTLTVLALFFTLRRFGTGAALAGMAWAAGSLWLIAVSRDGFQNMLAPLVGTLALWALFRLVEAPSGRRAALAGAAMGAGFWSYQPLKLLPFFAALWLWRVRVHDRAQYDAVMRHLRALVIGFLVIAGPMLVYAMFDPVGYFGRAAFTSVANSGNGIGYYLGQVLRTLGQFAITGDPQQRHDVNQLPLLGWPLTIIAATGLVVALRKRRADPRFMLVALGAGVFLLPPLLAPEGFAPHFLRNLGLMPYVGALVGIGTAGIVGWLGRRLRHGTVIGAGAAATLLVLLGLGSVNAYFSRPVSQRYDDYAFRLIPVAAAANFPNTLVVIDGFAKFDIQFLDRTAAPIIVEPRTHIANPGRYARIVTAYQSDMVSAVGPVLAARAVVVGRDLSGQPIAWSLTP